MVSSLNASFRCLTGIFLSAFLLAACATSLPHQSLPADKAAFAVVRGYDKNIRSWGDEPNPELAHIINKRILSYKKRYNGYYVKNKTYPVMNYLALSGGGDNGAFGAGILTGWTQNGDRPEFEVVTGVSTGALIAPFAFLGPRYDATLRDVYTNLKPDNIFVHSVWTILHGITGGLAVADNTPLSKKIKETVTPRIIREIAEEHRKGRRLLIATTNIEAQRSVIWDIGSIAASGKKGSLSLIRKIMLASTAVPGVVQPVFIDVTVDGKRYQEIHVDGGVTAQVFLFPLKTSYADRQAFEKAGIKRNLYIIRNAKITPEYEPLHPRLLSLSQRSIETLIKYQGMGDLYRLFIASERDGMNYHLLYAPSSFHAEHKQMFDPDYMTALFDEGIRVIKTEKSKAWHTTPPGIDYFDHPAKGAFKLFPASLE